MIIVFIRTLILYTVVIISIRLMGKRQVGELQPYELVITIMISDLASLPMQDVRLPLLLGIIPIITLLVAKNLLSDLQQKSILTRKFIDGSPCILIEKGKLNLKVLRSERINVDDVMEELRGQGFFNISDVQYAILENNGDISIMPRANKAPLTRDDINIHVQDETLPIILFMNNKIIKGSLDSIQKDEAWLDDELLKLNVKDKSNLFIVMRESNGKLFYQTKEELKNTLEGLI